MESENKKNDCFERKIFVALFLHTGAILQIKRTARRNTQWDAGNYVEVDYWYWNGASDKHTSLDSDLCYQK